MQAMFTTLLELMAQPLRPDRGVKTDNSVLLVYPPDRELDFREELLDTFVPALDAQKIPYRLVDLANFLFEGLDTAAMRALEEDEFDDYRWMKQGLSKRVDERLTALLASAAAEIRGGTVIVYATIALHPLVRFGEVLKGLRDVESRIALAFPGEERGGKLHFMNQPDGGNYLAVKLFWR